MHQHNDLGETQSVVSTGLPRLRLPFAARRQPSLTELTPTWPEAKPSRIAADLAIAQQRSAGGWYVVGRSRDLGARRSLVRTVGGREIALWRAGDGTVRASPGACPHLGALLADCPVIDGTLVCRWHGFRLGDRERGWQSIPALDDGALLWVRVAGLDDEALTEAPVPVTRPPAEGSISSVVVLRGECTPADVLANRLDPWHGAWFHPYAFSHLEVDEEATSPGLLVVDVTFRLGRTFGVPVRAHFRCPDARTIVMEIVAGEGIGSVVETHATPITPSEAERPITVVTELVVAHSTRFGFAAARGISPLLQILMRHTARQLWADDLAYAERRSLLRRRGEHDG